jgi:DNA topoisomerase I
MTRAASPSASSASPSRAQSNAARIRGLVAVSDNTPGITRRRRGKGFSYHWPDGRELRDQAVIQRINSLAIPPAWTNVWICPKPNGHMQATGRDARGRKQHRYHPKWTAVRDEAKYSRMLEFAAALPGLRRQISRDLEARGLPRRKVLAAVVQLLEKTLIRVGNDEYARTNGSFGLTTLLDRHAKVSSSSVRFRFKGKSGKEHDVQLSDPRLARIVRNCQELPGSQLFQYLGDDGKVHDVGSSDVNAYLRAAMGQSFTAKDFRTWAGTVLAAMALNEVKTFDSAAQAKRNLRTAIENVAARLGNTPTICRKCYVHPDVLTSYLDGNLVLEIKKAVENQLRDELPGLQPEEAAVLVMLRGRLAKEAGVRDEGARAA